MKKINIELTPYNGITILSFLREFVNEDLENDIKFTALKNAVTEFEEELMTSITQEQIDDALMENQIHRAIGTSPDN